VTGIRIYDTAATGRNMTFRVTGLGLNPDRNALSFYPEGCHDFDEVVFFVSDEEGEHDCQWLASNPSWQSELCVDDHSSAANYLCKETCKVCKNTVACDDDAMGSFTHQGAEKTCAWLAVRPVITTAVCVPGHAAYDVCKRTCDSCDLLSPFARSAAPSAVPSGTPSTEPSKAPSAEPAPTSPKKPIIPSNFCFSGESTVEVNGKGTILMKNLKLGDEIAVPSGKFERVYSFGHRHESMQAEFLLLLPSNLEISKNHMLMVEGRFVPASLVRVGDQIESATGEMVSVEAIHVVSRKGVYAPFTQSGTVVVSNIKASSYIAFQNSESLSIGPWQTGLTFQWVAHTSQSPHRIFSRVGFGGESYTDSGMSTWVALPHELFQWLLGQNFLVKSLVLVPALLLAGASSAIETVFDLIFVRSADKLQGPVSSLQHSL
jgi:hypothetical protein